LVIANEICRRKEKGEPIIINEDSAAKLFLQMWMDRNKDFVMKQFKLEEDSFEFVVGILFGSGTLNKQ
jgi:hypothetical protein